ncbi:MAG: DUF2254 domain-containing protein [Solirubrobacteraceae bacterium]
MSRRLKTLRQDLSQSLAFLPVCVVVLFAVAAVGLGEIDKGLDAEAITWAFSGDQSAARTVLSVVAGSLITVAGLTFSITIVVLQLASSQFSPRILRTFFGDRITQATIGTFVGTFVYALLVLRSVGSFSEDGFVPRLSVTVATVLAVAAVALLVVFLNHVARLIQVSHVAADLAGKTGARLDALYPERIGGDVEEEEDGRELVARWRRDPGGRVDAQHDGFVRRVTVTQLLRAARDAGAERVAVLVRPGDFVAVGALLAEVWPAAAAERCRPAVRQAVVLGRERELHDDAAFGLRQLGDIGIKALSPSISDPATAVTSIGYLRSLLVRLAAREPPSAVRCAETLTVVVARRDFEEDLDVLVQMSRYVRGDAWVAEVLIEAIGACADAARASGAGDRELCALRMARTVGDAAGGEARTPHDAALVARATARACAGGRRPGPTRIIA